MSESPPRASPDGPSRTVWLDYLSVVVLSWRPLAALTLASGALAFGGSWIMRRTYTAQATFVPATGPGPNLPAGIGNLASQFGFAIPSPDAGSSPEFYVRLVRSREIIDSLVLSPFRTVDGKSVTLASHLGVSKRTVRATLDAVARKLRTRIEVSSDRQTNIVRMSVEVYDPLLAADLANRLVALLNRFNLDKRNSQARERRAFVESRLQTSETELRAAEDAQRNFLAENRTFNVPRLQFEYARMERRVQVRQEVYLTLQREFELARIQEVNDTPVITTIDAAVPPAEHSGPRRMRIAAAAAVLGLIVGLGSVIFLAYIRGLQAANDRGWSHFREVWARSKPTWLRRSGTLKSG